MDLFGVRELSDVFVDACLRDESGSLLMLSCYGRDTALQQLFAAFSLPASQGGLDALSLIGSDGRRESVSIERPEALKKVSGRLPKENLFGNLAQAWIFDPALSVPDRSNRIGWVLSDPTDEASALEGRYRGVWSLVEALSPVPLLVHWRGAVLDAIAGSILSMRSSAFPPLGRIDAVRVHVPEEFPEIVSSLVRAGTIGLDASQAVLAA